MHICILHKILYLYLLYHVCASLIYIDPEADKEATRLLTDNAEKLMNAVGTVLNITESDLTKELQKLVIFD